MPKERNTHSKYQKDSLCVEDLRHAEYYGMQDVFDRLYAGSKKNEIFGNLMEIILSKDNILLAYRNLKGNTGGKTPGSDNSTIRDIEAMEADEVIARIHSILRGENGFNPKPVRRVYIPKADGKERAIGIPSIFDRLIQQCIKQVLEPICEAKFSNNSYGFRPDRSAENAIKRVYNLIQLTGLHYVIEFDIKGFFDNVNHSKLIKQIWAMGIRDKELIYIIRRMLKAPILMPDGNLEYPDKGTPQGGILSPLLANIVLNELDHWVESQWETNPIAIEKGKTRFIGTHDVFDKSKGYYHMKRTNLKEMWIVRYADDIRILCRTKTQAEKTKIAVTKWLFERLKLEVSEEKTKVVNVKRHYSDFLGFKVKAKWNEKKQKHVICSKVSDKQIEKINRNLKKQVNRIAYPKDEQNRVEEINHYNKMVLGIQNYYCIATMINLDMVPIHREVTLRLENRCRKEGKTPITRTGKWQNMTKFERERFGKSKMLRFMGNGELCIYPIGYVQHKNPMLPKARACRYTPEGRAYLHENLKEDITIMHQLRVQKLYGRSIEYADNRLSLYSSQHGKCAVTGIPFKWAEEIHCHHIKARADGGTDKFDNLILVSEPIHKLIHATNLETINRYLSILNLRKSQIDKINELRRELRLASI